MPLLAGTGNVPGNVIVNATAMRKCRVFITLTLAYHTHVYLVA